MSYQAGIKGAFEGLAGQGAAGEFAEFFDRELGEELVREHLGAGEELRGLQRGQTRMPFLLRIIPLIPDVLTKPRHFALAVTNRRVLIVRIVKRLFGGRRSRLVAAISFDELASVTPASDAVTITMRCGREYRYWNMKPTAAAKLEKAIQRARGA